MVVVELEVMVVGVQRYGCLQIYTLDFVLFY
jgi:hypothetical protein